MRVDNKNTSLSLEDECFINTPPSFHLGNKFIFVFLNYCLIMIRINLELDFREKRDFSISVK